MKLQCKVSRGVQQGKILTPHKYKDGNYVVSKTRYKSDQIKVPSLQGVHDYLKKGYGVRMGNTDFKISPSLIKPDSILIIQD
jgi:hypothetical protein